jgi:hypothetical protein
MLSSTVLSGLTPYVDEVIVDCQCGFRSNGYNIKIFGIRQILKKKSEEEGT